MAYNFPASPTVGQSFADYVWDGQKWLKSPPGDATISAGPPVNPSPGQLWWDSDTGILYIYYNDGTSAQWVAADSAGNALTEAPQDGTAYGRKNMTWVRVVAAAGDSMTGPLVIGGNLTLAPAAAVTPANNGQLTFEATSNTTLRLRYKGSDGVVRSVVLALA